MSTNDGGPAFPRTLVKVAGGNDPFSRSEATAYGMSLRDYFAGQALGRSLRKRGDSGVDYEELARRAYALADAMIAERSR